MDERLLEALMAGGERVAAWADLLDEINVFPVADGDTGRNLRISLAPLGFPDGSTASRCRQLVTAATGNSGNIAAAFLVGFLSTADGGHFARAVSAGREAAWKAVAKPRPGTMLTVFDALDQAMRSHADEPGADDTGRIVEALDRAVRSTPELLPELKPAGVIDAGALGMFIFFEGLLQRLSTDGAAPMPLMPVTQRFAGFLRVTGPVEGSHFPGYCINTILTPSPDAGNAVVSADLGESVVAIPDEGRLRLHLHTADQNRTRSRLEALGDVVDWQAEPLTADALHPPVSSGAPAVHVMTDAAGSLTRADARQLGVTLLDNYLLVDAARIPETLVEPPRLYAAMAAGHPVSTAQASVYQRYQSYESAVERHGRVLYLAVGSVYTGNVATARKWREANGRADRFEVVDTGAASGRLGLIVRQVACFARSAETLAAVSAFAGRIIDRCGELLFLDQLKFLVAGGRISRSKGFFGDFLGIKPVITPLAEGAVKVGTVRKEGEQVAFALDYLRKRFTREARLSLLVQFSDNENRVREVIQPAMVDAFPQASIGICPLSLTSGAHMGPGTWGVAFCPDLPVSRS